MPFQILWQSEHRMNKTQRTVPFLFGHGAEHIVRIHEI